MNIVGQKFQPLKTKNKSAIQPWETSLQKLTRHGKKLFAITSSGPSISSLTSEKGPVVLP